MHIEQSDFHEQLVRGLAHKMNNILSLFQGYLGLMLEDKNLDRNTLEGLARIRKGAQAASDLMDRTRVFAKPSSAVWREMDVAEFFEMSKPSLETLCERGVKLEISLEENLPRLWVDVSRLRMALMEIVRNAVQASPVAATVVIHARTETRRLKVKDENGAPQPITWIALTVTDEGEGIAPEIASKIFQPFFSTRRKQDAMGLGLSVALGLVQQLGGVIRFSKTGSTSFRILLPSRT